MLPPEQPIFEYTFQKKDGEQITSDKYLTDTLMYKYVGVRQTNEEKTKAKITDYAVSSVEGEDVTQSTFEGTKLLFIIYDASKASTKNIDQIRELIKALDGKIEMMALTSSGADQFEAFRHRKSIGGTVLLRRRYCLKDHCSLKSRYYIVGEWHGKRHVASQRYP